MKYFNFARFILLVAVMMLVVGLPLGAQDGWPTRCTLPDLEDAFDTASDAQANGDEVAFLNALSDMVHTINRSRGRCLEGAVFADIDLEGVDLEYADVSVELAGVNLEGAHFSNANLLLTILSDANLKDADLSHANLLMADFSNANLEGADLSWTNMGGTNLSGANLQGANLPVGAWDGAWGDNEANFDEYTTLPDRTNWTPDTDLTRFTDPEHPDFWDPCVSGENWPWYCEDSDE